METVSAMQGTRLQSNWRYCKSPWLAGLRIATSRVEVLTLATPYAGSWSSLAVVVRNILKSWNKRETGEKNLKGFLE
jgi:hypothetical protein